MRPTLARLVKQQVQQIQKQAVNEIDASLKSSSHSHPLTPKLPITPDSSLPPRGSIVNIPRQGPLSVHEKKMAIKQIPIEPDTQTLLSSRPRVYERINQILKDPARYQHQVVTRLGGDDAHGLNIPAEQLNWLKQAREAALEKQSALDAKQAKRQEQLKALQTMTPEQQQEALQETPRPHPFPLFLHRLKKDGGDKIVTFEANVVHVEYTRFITLCDQVKGLSLDQAILQLKWHRKPITSRFNKAFHEAILKAKEQGFDLSQTYVADVYVRDKAAILSQHFVSSYLKGRGRYGSTPHPKTCLLRFTLQQRDKPFASRQADPLEWIRDRLRERLRNGQEKLAEQVVEQVRQLRPVKPVYC